jgi:hypothetical protein
MFIIFFVPPFHWFIILLLICLITHAVFIITKYVFKSKKKSLLAVMLAFIILSLLALDLFEPVNIILTISLFVGILILLK